MPVCLSTVSEKLFAVPVTTVITKVVGYISSYTLSVHARRFSYATTTATSTRIRVYSAFSVSVLSSTFHITPKFFDLVQIGGL